MSTRVKNIFVCLTSYQFYLAFVQSLKLYEENREESYILFKGRVKFSENDSYPFLKVKYICNKTILHKILARLYYVYGPGLISVKKGIQRGQMRIFYFNDREPITALLLCRAGQAGKVVLIEEGLGTYLATGSLKVIGSSAQTKQALVGFPELYQKYHPCYRGEIERLEYGKYFTPALAAQFISYIGMEKTVKRGKIKVLFLGQQLNTYAERRENEWECLGRISALMSLWGGMYIKPHPTDQRDKYRILGESYPEVHVLGEDIAIIPVECLCFYYQVHIVISFFSSACVTLAYLNPSMKIVFLYELDIFEEFRQGCSLGNYKEFLDQCENVYFPRTLEELRELLSEWQMEAQNGDY